ncbi:MAG: hypothetical protein QM802_03015 [Agriterribacter sp.]
MKHDLTYKELISEGRIAEANGEQKKAAENYKRAIKKIPRNHEAYYRLMILYRKAKQFRNELTIINQAIRRFQKFHQEMPRRKKLSPRLLNATKTLAKSVGLLDSSGNKTHLPQPIVAWQQRRRTVLKKMR